jgi:putative membrane protein
MALLTNLLILLVALLHLYFLVLEMFLWDKPKGMKVFGLTPQKAADTKVLAANQGLYNGFLAAGLFWGLFQSVTEQGDAGLDFKVFFLLCVVVAGVYGAMTVGKKILYVQAMPAALALALLFLSLS